MDPIKQALLREHSLLPPSSLLDALSQHLLKKYFLKNIPSEFLDLHNEESTRIALMANAYSVERATNAKHCLAASLSIDAYAIFFGAQLEHSLHSILRSSKTHTLTVEQDIASKVLKPFVHTNFHSQFNTIHFSKYPSLVVLDTLCLLGEQGYSYEIAHSHIRECTSYFKKHHLPFNEYALSHFSELR